MLHIYTLHVITKIFYTAIIQTYIIIHSFTLAFNSDIQYIVKSDSDGVNCCVGLSLI